MKFHSNLVKIDENCVQKCIFSFPTFVLTTITWPGPGPAIPGAPIPGIILGKNYVKTSCSTQILVCSDYFYVRKIYKWRVLRLLF